MKSPEEIAAEIATLKKFAPLIPQRSAFDDDNRASIEAQIEALEDEMGQDDIDDKEDGDEWTSYEASSATDAINWRNDDEESPSSGWKSLIK